MGDADAQNGNGNGGTFTTKEMLVRLDGKLDVVAARQSHFDVELALLKARTDMTEKDQIGIATQLDAARILMATEIQNIKHGQVSLGRALKWATATVIGAGVLIDAAIRFYK